MKKEFSKRELVVGLRKLTEELKRVPIKVDLLLCNYLPQQETFKKNFGSYYEALAVSGISGILNRGISNVCFSKDGHLCNSTEEAIIDDLLFENNIDHEKEVNYPNSRYIADWKIGNLYLEYTSIESFKLYSDRLKEKVAFIKENNLNVLFLGKKDLINQEFIKKFK